MKRRYNSKDSDPVIGEVYLNVTSYAARLILEQYETTKKFSYSFTESANDIYERKSSAETVYHTTSKSCNRKFFVNVKLQCRHSFALRKHIKAQLYQNIQCDHRFSRNQTLTFPSSTVGCIEANPVNSSFKTLTLEEKYLHAERLMKEISGYLSLLGTAAFQSKMEQLQNLLNHWKGNGEVVILESSCNPADSTMVGASGLAVETLFNSQDSSIKLGEGTHERNTTGDDETNATGDDALVLETLVETSGLAVLLNWLRACIRRIQLVAMRRMQLVMMLLT